MKTTFTVSLLALAACFLGLDLAAEKDTKPQQPAIQEAAAKPADSKLRLFMRGKLTASQDVLDGLVTEDFAKIQKGGEKMVVMSKAADFQVIQGPTYAQLSSEFRRAVERLVTNAKKKQLDSAALSYMHVTMTCINCHKYVKNAKVARAEPLSPGLQTALKRDAAHR